MASAPMQTEPSVLHLTAKAAPHAPSGPRDGNRHGAAASRLPRSQAEGGTAGSAASGSRSSDPRTRLSSCQRARDLQSKASSAQRAAAPSRQRSPRASRLGSRLRGRGRTRRSRRMPASARARSSRLPSAAALRTLEGLRPSTPAAIAARLARGARSGIGIASFEHGGVIARRRPRRRRLPPPLVARAPFPDAWRVILILDRARRPAWRGEIEAFAALPPSPRRAARNLPARADAGVCRP